MHPETNVRTMPPPRTQPTSAAPVGCTIPLSSWCGFVENFRLTVLDGAYAQIALRDGRTLWWSLAAFLPTNSTQIPIDRSFPARIRDIGKSRSPFLATLMYNAQPTIPAKTKSSYLRQHLQTSPFAATKTLQTFVWLRICYSTPTTVHRKEAQLRCGSARALVWRSQGHR